MSDHNYHVILNKARVGCALHTIIEKIHQIYIRIQCAKL